MDDYAVTSTVFSDLDRRFRTYFDDTFTRFVSRSDAGFAEDRAAGREVGTGDELHEFGNVGVRIVDKVDRRVYRLRDVVRRDVARHTDRDTARSVDKQFREAR